MSENIQHSSTIEISGNQNTETDSHQKPKSLEHTEESLENVSIARKNNASLVAETYEQGSDQQEVSKSESAPREQFDVVSDTNDNYDDLPVDSLPPLPKKQVLTAENDFDDDEVGRG